MIAPDAHVDEWLGLYALGTLSPLERASVEKHLAACPRCRALSAEARGIAVSLPLGLEPITPTPELKVKLFARIDADLAQAPLQAGAAIRPVESPAQPQPAPKTFSAPSTLPVRPVRAAPAARSRWQAPAALLRFSPALAFASLLLVLALGSWALSLQRELEAQRAITAVLQTPNLQARPLVPTDAAGPGARANLLETPGGTVALLTVSGLKPLSPGRVYEFWLIQNKTPVPAGVFSVDANGTAALVVHTSQPLGAYQVGAITEEPSGGSPLPTGDILLSGGF